MLQFRVLLFLAVGALAAGCGSGGGGAAPGRPADDVEAPDAPKIRATTPAENAVVDAFDRTVTVTYDRALDPATITLDAIRVVSPLGEVFGLLSHVAEDFVLRYELSSEMFRDTPYQIVVAAGLEALGGSNPTIERRIPFETLPAVNLPTQIVQDSGSSLPMALEVTESGFGLFVRKENVNVLQAEVLHARAFDPDSGLELDQVMDEGVTIGLDAQHGLRVAPGRNAVATWRRESPVGDRVFARRFNPVTFSWTDALPMQNFAQGPPSLPRAAVSTNGDAIVTWVEDRPLQPIARMRLFDVRVGRWGGDFPVDAGNPPTVSVDADMGNNGDTMLVFVRQGGSLGLSAEITARVRTAETGFQLAEVIRTSDAEVFEVDEVVYAPNGMVHALWREIVNGDRKTTLYHARFVPESQGGQGWETAQEVDVAAGDIDRVHAAAANDGSLAVAWVVNPDPESSRVRMAHVAANGKAGAPEDGQQDEAQVEGDLRMDAQRDGTVALAWLGKREGAIADQYRAALYSPQSDLWTRGAVGPQRSIGAPSIDIALRPDGNAEVRWVEPVVDDRMNNDVIQAIQLVHGGDPVDFRPVPLDISGKSDVLIDLDGLGRGMLAWLHRAPPVRHSARADLR